MKIARRDEDASARREAILSLAEYFPDDETRALLTDFARCDGNSEFRCRAIWSLAMHFRDFPETAEALREIVAGERGRLFVSKIVSDATGCRALKEYLKSFLKDPGVAEP